MILLRPTRNARLLYGLAITSLLVVAYVSYTAYDPFALAFHRFTGANPPSSISPTGTTNTNANMNTNADTHTSAMTPGAPHPPLLLVTAFFPLTHSKHSMTAYKSWLTNLLGRIRTPIYIYTTPVLAPVLRELHESSSSGPTLMINTTYTSPFDVPPLRGQDASYAEMWAWDRERKIHGPELYAVWNAKPFFLDEGLRNANAALKANVARRDEDEGRNEHNNAGNTSPPEYEYEMAFWIDAGSFRAPHEYADWPDAQRVREVWRSVEAKRNREADAKAEDKDHTTAVPKELIFIPIWEAPGSHFRDWEESMGPVDTDFSEGSFFGGTAASIAWWRSVYYAYHDAYRARGIFVGKDQTLMNALLLLFPDRFATVWLRDPIAPPNQAPLQPQLSTNTTRALTTSTSEWNPEDGRCGNTWYYFEWWLASTRERKTMDDAWSAKGERVRWWWEVLWWVLGVGARPGSETATEVEAAAALEVGSASEPGFGSVIQPGLGPVVGGSRRCRLTEPILVEELLRRESVFGRGWVPPRRTIVVD
ncbi:hypothetical protein BJ138DRAFT_494138 [Hygrophoropsis aurantiaca]|uniref:Uncharacterized protein n=1 Tax=Hygrophoropsis aurantiaca TaxID=72124 RepID=A0ACB8A2Y3_9AGAM|nr:hypothetical protein BJ138DRAFT_494138 [Hygrophoropsis aurantiaca]